MTSAPPPDPAGFPAGLHLEPFTGDAGQNEQLRDLAENAFAEDQPPGSWEQESARFEPRGLVALDGGRIVGSNILYSLATSVPGRGAAAGSRTGEVATAGVSFVMVLPSHRRRGITRDLMGRVLTGLHDQRHESVAALWASEGTIYGRFGYGVATRRSRIVLPRRVGLVRADLADPLVPRLVSPRDGAGEVERLARLVRSVRPGMVARPEHWVPGEVADPPDSRHGAGPLRCVLMSAGDTVRAAARYAVRPATDGATGTEVNVPEIYSDGPGSHAALLRWLTELDLVTRVVLPARPVDDPVLDQLTDARAAEVTTGEALWIRLVDLDRALAARGYAEDVTAVLEVTDQLCPWNAGRWRMTVTDGEAELTRTADPVDVGLDTTALAGAYLGAAGTLSRLGRAGLVTVRTPGVLERLSRAFDSAVQPWQPFVF